MPYSVDSILFSASELDTVDMGCMHLLSCAYIVGFDILDLQALILDGKCTCIHLAWTPRLLIQGCTSYRDALCHYTPHTRTHSNTHVRAHTHTHTATGRGSYHQEGGHLSEREGGSQRCHSGKSYIKAIHNTLPFAIMFT